MPQICESRNELVKIQGHEVVYTITRIAYTTEWISLFHELVNTETWVSIVDDISKSITRNEVVYLVTWVNT